MTQPFAGPADGDGGPALPAVLPGRFSRVVRDQRFAFLVVGGLNTGVSFLAFLGFSRITSAWGGDAAVLAAQLVAIPVAFVLHRRLVFRVHGHVLRDLGRFALVNAIPVTVNLAVLPILSKVFHLPIVPAQLLFTLIWVVSSFFLHRGFSFRRSAGDQLGATAGGAEQVGP